MVHVMTMLSSDCRSIAVFTRTCSQDWLFPWAVVPLANATDVIPPLPWFLACNPARFPYWYGRPDPRNLHMLSALQCGQQTQQQQGRHRLDSVGDRAMM